MNNTNDVQPSSSTTTTTTLTPVNLNSIDTLTISYLKGEITFQQYESLIENQHFQQELMLNQLNAAQMDKLLFTASNNGQIGAEIELSTFDSSLTENPFGFPANTDVAKQSKKKSDKKRAAENNNNDSSQSSSPVKKPKVKDRFLNIKNIMNDKDLLADDEEDEFDIEDEDNEISDEDDDDEEEEDDDDEEAAVQDFDETSNWNDFDIETLNFDKFIKDNQITCNASGDSNREASANNRSQSGFNKRKNKDDNSSDPVELKAKRRVIFQTLFYFQ
jgi:hypothetical protein